MNKYRGAHKHKRGSYVLKTYTHSNHDKYVKHGNCDRSHRISGSSECGVSFGLVMLVVFIIVILIY